MKKLKLNFTSRKVIRWALDHQIAEKLEKIAQK